MSPFHEITWSQERVASLGTFDLTLSVGTLGTGNPPTITIMALLHGDEPSGLMVLYRMLRDRLSSASLRGTLRIIPLANPLAVMARQRTASIDGIDANRVSSGHPEGRPTERLVSVLNRIARDSEIVINLHEFEAASELTCVYAVPDEPSLRDETLAGILTFGPKTIWVLPEPGDDHEPFLQTFETGLAVSDTPGFIIELPRNDLISGDMMSQCLDGLTRLLTSYGVLGLRREKYQIPTELPRPFRRLTCLSSSVGIWTPEAPLLSEVQAGTLIGRLAILPHFDLIPHHAPLDGTIIQVRPEEVVHPNDILYAVGTPHEGVQKDLVDTAASMGGYLRMRKRSKGHAD